MKKVTSTPATVELARGLLVGAPPPHGAWYVAPGYAYFLALVFRWGGGFVAPKLVNLLGGAVSALLVWMLARRFTGRGAAIASGCVWALYPSMLLQEILLLKSSLAVVCVLGAVAAIPAAAGDGTGRSRRARWLLAGLALGAAVLLRAELVLLLLAFAGAGVIAIRRRFPGAPPASGPAVLLPKPAGAAARRLFPMEPKPTHGGL